VKPAQKPAKEIPVLLFADQQAWATWLAENHTTSTGLWLQLAKKASGLTSVSYAEALDIALCYGWIDGQKQSYDEDSWLQKFTPRGTKSIWSKINREKIAQLIERGLMQLAGLAAVESAKQDGRWDAAYDSARTMTVPDDFQAALDQSAPAAAFLPHSTVPIDMPFCGGFKRPKRPRHAQIGSSSSSTC